MIAKPAPVTTIPGNPTGWVFEMCKRPSLTATQCPGSGSSPNYYGGTLLHLEKGDLLKIHLVNQLPMATDSKHASEPGRAFLTQNPVNIHTHGLLVSPHGPGPGDPTYGDNVFVLTFNSANGSVAKLPHMHADVRYDFTDYTIPIPANHPSGLFWFHPHAHGLALNQISAGLGGIITIGELTDYITAPIQGINVRHMILKDAQILPNGTLQDQEDPNVCAPTAMQGEAPRQGSCAGQDNSAGGGTNYTGGHWYFTVNGQPFPTVEVNSNKGEIWRIANVSGSVTYDLNLWNAKQNRRMLFQVLSVDGVSVAPTAGTSMSDLKQIAGGKFVSEPCPADPTAGTQAALCTRKLHMMPSSRTEIRVTYRDENDNVATPPDGASAVLRTDGYQTGPSGDSWPAVHLAHVKFFGSADAATPNILSLKGEATKLKTARSLSADFIASNVMVASDASCTPLPPGHKRRIFYAVPTSNLSAFGLAYEEVDAKGRVVGKPATDVTPFDPMEPTICVPLGPNNAPVTERWELINIATEDHNFHLHQTKFRVLTRDEVDGTVLPRQILGEGVMLDNLPLAHANGQCGNAPPDDDTNPIADWRAGKCTTTPIVVEIPFVIAGDYVYHCHILEHEDGGMMARIRVRPTP